MAFIIRIMTFLLCSRSCFENFPFGVAITVSGAWTMKQRLQQSLMLFNNPHLHELENLQYKM